MAKRSGIMLCFPLEERRLKDPKFGWSYPVLTQPKLDGERCRAVQEVSGTINLISSELNDFMSVPHINEELEYLISKCPFPLPEFDGELYCHDLDFSEIHSIVSRSIDNLHPDRHLISLNIFDYVSNEAQFRRLLHLQNLNDSVLKDAPHINIVPTALAYSFSDIMKFYKKYLSQGYEGIIIRHLLGPYVRKRSNKILKFKPKKEDIYTIIGVNEAIDKYGNPKGMIGSFQCQGSDGTPFKIGAGELTHSERIHLWKIRKDLIGHDCLVQYQHLQPKTNVPRFGLCVKVLSSTFND